MFFALTFFAPRLHYEGEKSVGAFLLPKLRPRNPLQGKLPMKNFSRFLSVLSATVLCMGMAHAQTIKPSATIQDNLAPHAAIARFESFSTTLSVLVQNAPQPNDEIGITGVTYKWEGSGSGLHLTAPAERSTGLNSSSLPDYAGATGPQKVAVKCTVTYAQEYTKESGKSGTNLDPIVVVTEPKDIPFFIRIPKRVVQIAKIENRRLDGLPIPGDTKYPGIYWGHYDRYNLQVKDNQKENLDVGQAMPYGYAAIRESFPESSIEPAGAKPNGDDGPYTWERSPDGTYTPVTNFIDKIIHLFPVDPSTQVVNGVLIGPVPDDAIILEFDQTFIGMEPKVVNSSQFSVETTLNTHHIINRYKFANRTGDVVP